MIISKFENIKIGGISTVVPPYREDIVDKYSSVFGNDTVSKFSNMTGVLSRHLTEIDQTASDLAFVSAKHLIDKKNININDIGVLIFVTQTPDYKFPSTSCVLHMRLGLTKDCITYDINLGCSGYVFGLHTVAAIMNSSNIKMGLLLVGDTSNKTVSPDDKSTCMLFGEAGSATLLEKSDYTHPMRFALRTDGNGYKAIIVPAGAYRNLNVSSERTIWGDGNYRSDYDLYMNGTDVFNFTISEVPQLINEFINETNQTLLNIDSLVFHQANKYIIKQISKRVKFPLERVPLSIDKYGNTSVASIPLTISDSFGGQNGNTINFMICGFGIGLSWGVATFEISSDNIFSIIQSGEKYFEGRVEHD